MIVLWYLRRVIVLQTDAVFLFFKSDVGILITVFPYKSLLCSQIYFFWMDFSSSKKRWHFPISTLIASLTSTSGGKMPVDSTETEGGKKGLGLNYHKA